jgi:hypothetical protein
VAKPTTAVGQEILLLLWKPNIHYQYWTFSEPNVCKKFTTFNVYTLFVIRPFYFLITLPDSKPLGFQAAGHDRAAGDARKS